MVHSDYLDLAVGLAVVFFLAGMLVSGLNEGISWLTRVRAKFLWAYLYDLFNDDRSKRALPRGRLGIAKLWGNRNDKRPASGGSTINVSAGTVDAADWLKRVAYALDPIDAPQLTRGTGQTLTAIKSVPPGSLAQALLEVFADVGRQEVTRAIGTILDRHATAADVTSAIDQVTRRLDVASTDARAAFTTLRSTLEAIGDASDPALDQRRRDASDALAAALLPAQGSGTDSQLRDAWREAAAAWPNGVSEKQLGTVIDATARRFPASFARLRIEAAVSRLNPGSPLAPTMRRLWEAASGEIDGFREGVETYLDNELKRLSGYYRRSIRVIMFSLAFLIALLGGVDAISVGRTLWRNPQDRAALVALSDEVGNSTTTSAAATPAPAPAGGTNPNTAGLQLIQAACAKAHPPDDATITSAGEAAAAYAKVRNCVTDALDRLTGVGVIDHALWMDPAAWWHDWTTSRFWLHAIGIILTALALMLGAPFWFDIIKRATGLRKGLTGDT